MFSSKNSMRKNFTVNFDLKAFRNFSIAKYKCRFFFNIYNVFDRRNENIVWGNTGRSDQSAEIMNKALLVESLYPEILRPNTIIDFLNHPEWYYEPRQIQMGLAMKW